MIRPYPEKNARNRSSKMSRHPTNAIRRILCPVDFDEPISSANEFASMLAKTTGASIHYIYCACPEVIFGKREFNELKKEEAEDLQKLKTIKPRFRGIKTVYEIEFGNAEECIVDYASENECDIIVIGTHGRKGIGRMFMGSVAEDVMRNADCPVVSVKSNTHVPCAVG